ncbi:hypothetical protein SRM_00791 [Salinibacter ruber M8]|uniref:Uncharacterized protein n=1 Tax=Salinibacter ruber (strain M8) TaxID=761659 RepID=D5H6Q7_SALRM|nr:hypothetical protein SRM_00791 [Salinibacter ruber M8]
MPPQRTWSSRGKGVLQVATGRLEPPEARSERLSDLLVAVAHARREDRYQTISARRARDDERVQITPDTENHHADWAVPC